MVSLETAARNAIEGSLGVKAGEKVWIHGWDHTLELMSHLAWHCTKRACQVITTVQIEDYWFRSMLQAPLEIIQEVGVYRESLLKETDAYVFTLGPRKPIAWDKVPEERRKEVSVWLDERFDQSAFTKEWAKIAKERRVRMLGIEATLATPERAEVLGLSHKEWRNVMLSGCVADYHEIERHGKTFASLFKGREEVHITTPHGTNLRFRLDHRPVDVSDGITTKEKAERGVVTFLPAGSAEVCADERSAEGKVVYDVPIRVKDGSIVGLTLHVKDGEVVEFTAKERKEVFERYLKEGKGDAHRFAFFGLGLNPNLKHGFTQDDKVLGGVTVGFGDNQNKGGKNSANGTEWWASMTRATITLGDTRVMQNGTLLA